MTDVSLEWKLRRLHEESEIDLGIIREAAEI